MREIIEKSIYESFPDSEIAGDVASAVTPMVIEMYETMKVPVGPAAMLCCLALDMGHGVSEQVRVRFMVRHAEIGADAIPFEQWDDNFKIRFVHYLVEKELATDPASAVKLMMAAMPTPATNEHAVDDAPGASLDIEINDMNVVAYGVYRFKNDTFVGMIPDDDLDKWLRKAPEEIREKIKANPKSFYYVHGYNPMGRDDAVLLAARPELVSKNTDLDALMVVANEIGQMSISLKSSAKCNSETCFILDATGQTFSYVIARNND
jgi:hypothetical protein